MHKTLTFSANKKHPDGVAKKTTKLNFIQVALDRAAFRWVRVPLFILHQKKKTTRWVVFLLVETTGLEPVTSCV